jgi:hypothetical protein
MQAFLTVKQQTPQAELLRVNVLVGQHVVQVRQVLHVFIFAASKVAASYSKGLDYGPQFERAGNNKAAAFPD